jgi:class 3 adenylate cyclase
VDTAELAAIAVDRRVPRSFAFLDLCGFTDYVDEHGDEAAVRELQVLRAIVREVTPLFGVRVEKWLGDGVMIVSVDAEPLVGATMAIELRHGRDGRLPLRGGVASGRVLLLEGDDYIGRAVNLASRLCDIAAPGQILAAENGELQLPEWLIAEPHEPVAVKGMAEPVPVVSLTADRQYLRKMSRGRTAQALLAVVEGLTRPMRGWTSA